MNMLEQYIDEVHSETPYTEDWTKEYPDEEFVEVDITTNCYGSKTRTTQVFTTRHWEHYKAQGYYMG